MVTGTQINVKSLALKLLSSLALLPRTKVCHFCCVCRQKRTCKKQERNWSTFFKSFGKFSISRVQWHPQEKMSFESNKTLLSSIVSCPCFLPTFFLDPFERLEVYDQFYYRHETSFLLLLLYKYLRF